MSDIEILSFSQPPRPYMGALADGSRLAIDVTFLFPVGWTISEFFEALKAGGTHE